MDTSGSQVNFVCQMLEMKRQTCAKKRKFAQQEAIKEITELILYLDSYSSVGNFAPLKCWVAVKQFLSVKTPQLKQ